MLALFTVYFLLGFPALAQFGWGDIQYIGSYRPCSRVGLGPFQGRYAYCSDGLGFSVWDFEDPEHPVEVALRRLPGAGGPKILVDQRVYKCDGGRGLATFDISNPTQPVLIDYLEMSFHSGEMFLEGDILYVCTSEYGIYIFSIGDPDHPEFVGRFQQYQVSSYAKNDQYLYLATNLRDEEGRHYNLTVLSLENPEQPQVLGHVEGQSDYGFGDIAVMDSILIAMNYSAFLDSDTLTIYSLSNPAEPQIIHRFRLCAGAANIIFSDSIAYIDGSTVDRDDRGLFILNMIDPRNPELLSRIRGRFGQFHKHGSYLYGSASWDGFQIIDVADPENPQVIVDELPPYNEYLSIDVEEGLSYVQDGGQGFAVISVEDPYHPQFVADFIYDNINDASRMYPLHMSTCKYQNFLFVPGPSWRRADIVSIFNIENPAEPQPINSLNIITMPKSRTNFIFRDNYLYMANWLQSLDFEYQDQNLAVVDISDPAQPEVVRWRQDARFAREYSCMDGDLLYQVAKDTPGDNTSYVLVYSLAEPGSPELLGRWPRGDYEELIVHEGYAYVSFSQNPPNDGFIYIYQLETPTRSRLVGSLEIGMPVYDMCREDNIIYLSLDRGQYGFACISIEDPENPEIVGWYDTPGQIWGFKADNGYLYVADKYELGIYDCAELHGIWNLQPSEYSHEFGDVQPDTSVVWELILTNVAQQAVEILGVAIDSVAFSAEFEDTLTLEPDEEAAIPIRFAPTEARDYSGTLTVQTERRDIKIALTGTGNFLFAQERESDLPSEFALHTSYPNPFNSTTVIRYDVPRRSQIKLAVYDLAGREVETLLSRELNPGRHSTIWNSRSNPAGIYFMRLESIEKTTTTKALLIK